MEKQIIFSKFCVDDVINVDVDLAIDISLVKFTFYFLMIQTMLQMILMNF